MFSGIVQENGTVKNLEFRDEILSLTIVSEELIDSLKEGSSVSVNGCCLTVVEVLENSFKVEVTEETLKKTNLSNLRKDSKVNLELPLKVGDRIDGHLVLGHVDTIGKVSGIESFGENTIVTILFKREFKKYIAPKGSITVNGVSLTIVEVKADLKQDPVLSFTLIPFSRDNTNLGSLKIDDAVNLEMDIISRYLVNYVESEKVIKNYA